MGPAGGGRSERGERGAARLLRRRPPGPSRANRTSTGCRGWWGRCGSAILLARGASPPRGELDFTRPRSDRSARPRKRASGCCRSSTGRRRGSSRRRSLAACRARGGGAPGRGFLQVLVARYGPAGRASGRAAQRLPIRRWQIWNEPNFVLFWHPAARPREYARLLDVSARASAGRTRGEDRPRRDRAGRGRDEDRGPSCAGSCGSPGRGRDADVVALHPYSASTPADRLRGAPEPGGDGRAAGPVASRC